MVGKSRAEVVVTGLEAVGGEPETVVGEAGIADGDERNVAGGMKMVVGGIDVVVWGDDLPDMEINVGGRDEIDAAEAERMDAKDPVREEEVEQRLRLEEVVVLDDDDEEARDERPWETAGKGTRGQEVGVPESISGAPVHRQRNLIYDDEEEEEEDLSAKLITRPRGQRRPVRIEALIQRFLQWKMPVEKTRSLDKPREYVARDIPVEGTGQHVPTEQAVEQETEAERLDRERREGKLEG